MHIVIYLLLLLVCLFLFIKWVCGLNFAPLFTENLSSPDQTVPYIPDTILYFQCPEYIHDPSHSPQSMHLSSMFPRVTPHFLCPRLSIICPRSFSVGCSNILPNNYRVHLDLLQLPQKNKTKKQQQVELWHEQTVTNSLLTQNNCRYTLICMKKTTTKNHLDKWGLHPGSLLFYTKTGLFKLKGLLWLSALSIIYLTLQDQNVGGGVRIWGQCIKKSPLVKCSVHM